MATTAIIEKRVNEKFAIGFSYTAPDLAAGQHIDAVVVTAGAGLSVEGAPAIIGTDEVSQVIYGGTAGTDYTVLFKVTTSAGYIYEDVYVVKVI
jgi:hypothetical protein